MDYNLEIKRLAKVYKQEIIDNRTHLHMHPELSFQEHNTMRFVVDKLKLLDIEIQEGVAGTGIVALIKGKNPNKKVVALRADMDALPILETNDVPYKSQNEGVMHACGHDVHTSSLLGTARILSDLREYFEGTVKLVFQPGEELLPGGASLMIKEGVLENPAPNAMIGQHVMPYIDVGKVGFREGTYMASADEIYVQVNGIGGHGAMPERCVDPILIASHIIIALQQVVSRIGSPKIPSVLTFGDIVGKGATNIIPSKVNLQGTFRTLDEEWRAEAHQRMTQIATGMAASMGGTCDFDIRKGYPYLYNNVALTKRNKASAIEFLGEENVEDLDIWMAAEDFAFYTHHTDACFYRLGIRNEAKNIVSGVHTSTFDIDLDALEIGSGLMAYLTFKELAT